MRRHRPARRHCYTIGGGRGMAVLNMDAAVCVAFARVHAALAFLAAPRAEKCGLLKGLGK